MSPSHFTCASRLRIFSQATSCRKLFVLNGRHVLPCGKFLVANPLFASVRLATTSSAPSLDDPRYQVKADASTSSTQAPHTNQPINIRKVVSKPRRLFEESCTVLNRTTYDYEHGWTLYSALRNAGRPDELKIKMAFAFAERCIELVQKASTSSSTSSQARSEMRHHWGKRIATVLLDMAQRLSSPAIRRTYEDRWYTLATKSRALRSG